MLCQGPALDAIGEPRIRILGTGVDIVGRVNAPTRRVAVPTGRMAVRAGVSAALTGHRAALAPQDATRFWLSRRGGNDLFLLYCFDDTGHPDRGVRDAVIARSAGIADLRLRIREHRFAYPSWEPCEVEPSQVVVHDLDEPLWTNVENSLARLLGTGVPAERHAWRLHLFREIRDAPAGSGPAAATPGTGDAPALVAVLQISHALADGRRAAAIARELLTGLGEPATDRAGRTTPDTAVPTPGAQRVAGQSDLAEMRRGAALFERRVHGRESCAPGTSRLGRAAVEATALFSFPWRLGCTVRRGLAAARAERELNRLTEAGEIPPPAPGFAPTRLNQPPAPEERAVRMLVGADLRAPGHTVTVVALTAISLALSRYLAARGDRRDHLGAQVSMALPVDRKTVRRNNYRDLGIDLGVAEPDLRLRADRIAATLAERRRRATHPLQQARDRVNDVVPAPVLRRDVAGYPLDLVPETLSGHTVVSSVHRGPADLSVLGGRVRFTAGFPALGSVMHLTHGLHGLGNTLTLSVHSDPQVMPDVDEYVELLEAAVREVVECLAAVE